MIFGLFFGDELMTLDKSLKVAGGSIKSRNVMTRVERLTRLKELERWKEGDPVLGIPKTRVVKVSLKKKKKVKGPEEDDKKKKGGKK
jgi:small basic protein (TIGR04137 family)